MAYKDKVKVGGEWHDLISCDKCGDDIGVFDEFESHKHIQGLNHGIGGKTDHECHGCKSSRHSRYDDYVDPLNAYH